MLQVSDAYKELVKSNIRPKCEPIIKISGKDNTGKNIELVWKAKNIKDLIYKRGIDPVGRELPYMELTWTEIYTGKLNAQSYPEKYNNVAKYMKVELSFVQDLGFYNTWKTIFNGGTKWKDLFSKTWKEVKNKVSQEIITLPKMFLTARPTIKGQTITWVAKDFLSFVEDTEVAEFRGDKFDGIYLVNAISYFLLNSRSGFLQSLDLFNAFTNSARNILLQHGSDLPEYVITERIICNDKLKNIILNLASVYNLYFDFENDTVKLNRFIHSNTKFYFNKKVLYNYPEIENSTNVSSYVFKHRIAEVDNTNVYNKMPYQVINLGNNKYHLLYVLDGYGEAYETPDLDTRLNDGSLKEVNLYETYENSNKNIYVVPVNYNSYNNTLNTGFVGEVFNEDNPINPYDLKSYFAIERKEFLVNYFNGCSGLSFEALPNICLETNDMIDVDTNLYDNEGNRIVKKAVIVSIELNYNGSLKQKIKAHEVLV